MTALRFLFLNLRSNRNMLCGAIPSHNHEASTSMPIKLMTEAALVAAFLAGATPAEAQSFHNVVETFYADEFRAHPIAATDIGVHDYDAEVDDLSRDGQAKNTARLRTALNAFIAIDPATLAAGDRDDREMLINSIKGKLLDVETIRYWQKDPDVYVRSARRRWAKKPHARAGRDGGRS